MIIDIENKKEHVFFNIKYIGVYKDIIILSDGTLKKNLKQFFWKKINAIMQKLQLINLEKNTPNAFFYIGDKKISYNDKNKLLIEFIYKKTIKEQFYIKDFSISNNNISIGCSSAYSTSILFKILFNYGIEVILNEKHKILIKNLNDLKIKLTTV